MQRADEAARDEIRTLWASLSSTERRVLTTIAESQRGVYARSAPGPQGGSVARAVSRLEGLREIVEATGTPSGWRVVDPLLTRWIRRGRHQ